MSYYVRKFSRSKWQNLENNEAPLEFCELKADSITSCLRTTKDTLSFWIVENINDSSEINEIILALSTHGNAENIASVIDLIFIEKEFLESKFDIRQCAGDTVITDLQSKHYDLINLNVKKIEILGNIFCDIINESSLNSDDNGKIIRKREKDIKGVLRDFLDSNPDSKTLIKEKLLNKIYSS